MAPTPVTRTDVAVTVQGGSCVGWYYSGRNDDFSGSNGRPCVVMAHGFGGTRDSGLEEFAEGFARIGLEVLPFDYRGFGASGGDVRQTVSTANQLEDYRRAIDFARTAEGVDPRRIVVWGVSLSGGYALTLGSEVQRVSCDRRADAETDADVALSADARATSGASRRQYSVGHMAKSTFVAVRDKIATSRRRSGVTMPITGRPGEIAVLALPGFHESYHAIAGPAWRNEVAAKSLLKIGSFRAVEDADKITIPVLVQIADHDRCAPRTQRPAQQK